VAARFCRFLVLAFALFSASGCSAFFRSKDVTPSGLTRSDATLRGMLASGNADTALHRFDLEVKQDITPSDDLLRALYQGVLAFHAGRKDTSAFVLDRAALMLEDREGIRVSREAAALLSSDRALPYQPGRTERLLIPYYGALSYLHAGNTEEAAVEARRLSHALEALEDAPKDAEQRTRGLLRYFAGLVFDAAGERNDAAVAYRNAEQLLGRELTPSQTTSDSGDVVIVFEDGFVAHRFEESVTIILADDEAESLRDHDQRRRDQAAAQVAERAITQALRPAAYSEGPRRPRHKWYLQAPPRKHRTETCTKAQSDSTTAAQKNSPAPEKQKTEKSESCKKDDDDFYILRLAWPAYHATRRPLESARVLVGDTPAPESLLFMNVSDAVVGDFERDRVRILARTIARAAAKLALVKSAEKSTGKNESLGKLLGTIANVSGAVLEQADTRSWTLLPGSIGMMRLRLPAGSHPLTLEMGGDRAPHSAKRLDLGTVQVIGGRTAFVTARHW
jgi:hypothetical protein